MNTEQTPKQAPQTSQVNTVRRHWLAASAAGAAAGLGGFAPAGLAQGQAAKPMPPVASFKNADAMIVHSASGVETRRGAFGTSGITDVDRLFLRNNIAPPKADAVENPDAWKVEFDGVSSPTALTVADLKRMGLETVAMVLQCSGNGRAFFKHKAAGSQWKVGAAGNVLWSGVPVRDVVAALGGVRQGMRYMTSTGGETLPPGVDPATIIVERSVPWTAMEEAILAWELNGAPIPLAHGGPIRLIIPGYYGVNNIKYVKRVAFTVDETRANIQKSGYRVRDIGKKGDPTQPTMWEMNLKSFVTHPSEDGQNLRPGLVQVQGVAFSGGSPVRGVEISVDGGKSWQAARFVGPHMGRHAWREFVAQVNLAPGKYTITSRAIAADGSTQPEMRVENERGYAHNGWRDHALTVNVT